MNNELEIVREEFIKLMKDIIKDLDNLKLEVARGNSKMRLYQEIDGIKSKITFKL